jgi:hypothetical protein
VQASENDRQPQDREIYLADVETCVGGRERVVPEGDGDIRAFSAERIHDRANGFMRCPVSDDQFPSAAGQAAGMALVGLRRLDNLASGADQVLSARRQCHVPGSAPVLARQSGQREGRRGSTGRRTA